MSISIFGKKRLLIIILVFLLLIIVGSLVIYEQKHKTNPVRIAGYSGPPADIRIGNVGEYSIFNLIARDKGYFKQNGLNATITEYASGPPAVTDLLAGKQDLAVAADFVGVSNIFSHPNLRILSQLSQQFTFSIIARKDKGIANPADLKGKRIGVTKNGAGEFFLGRFLNFNGLQISDVSEVNLAPADLKTQITKGQIDAIVIFEPHVYGLSKSLGDKVIIWSAQGEEPTLALSYSTKEFIGSHPDVINRYIKSLLEAQQYLESNDQASQNLLANDLHYNSAYVAYLWPKIKFHLSLEQSTLLSMEDEARFVIQNNLTKQKIIPNYLDYIYFNALNQESPESINIIH